jgi:putative nucleotidyltransferase with HDIG domain
MYFASHPIQHLHPRPARLPTWYAPVIRHSERVAIHADQIARHYGMGTEQLRLISWAARWHDYGKLALGPGLVNAPRPLSEAEWTQMRRHPRIGAAFCHRMGAPLAAVRIIDAHHERWDGTGYSSGLSRRQIPLGAQIIALADVFDAITSDRPYRRAMPLNVALDLMRAERERAFHPDLLDLALTIFSAVTPLPCTTA